MRGSLGVGIFCGDYSECEVRRNVIRDTRPTRTAIRPRAGYAVQGQYYARSRIEENRSMATRATWACS